VEESKFCLFSMVFPVRCISSISPRLYFRKHAFCFLPLVAILESPFFQLLCFLFRLIIHLIFIRHEVRYIEILVYLVYLFGLYMSKFSSTIHWKEYLFSHKNQLNIFVWVIFCIQLHCIDLYTYHTANTTQYYLLL
jgi:hypothetical protein